MEIIRDSSLHEYASHFWMREKEKKGRVPSGNFDPVLHLSQKFENGGHPYKLPHDTNKPIHVAKLDQSEVEALLIHDYMRQDTWMTERNLVADPPSCMLKDLAKTAIARGYFQSNRNETQTRNYKRWQDPLTFASAITGDEKIFIEWIGPGQYEIIDGWGRLLPFAALLEQGYAFHPIESYVASALQS